MSNAIELRAGDGALVATYEPDAGMRCASLRHQGVELLTSEPGIADPVLREAMRGIPFLHPWANRVATDDYAAGVHIPAEAPFVPRDGNGLAIHGLVAAPGDWVVSAEGGALRGQLAFPPDPERGAAFPFPHRVTLDASVADGELAVSVRLEPSGDAAVPVAFGFHPYLRPRGHRSGWRISLPAMTRLETDGAGLPTGERSATDAFSGPLPEATLDAAYVDLEPGAELAVEDGELCITVRLESGYRAAQVYSPEEGDFVCFEPATAPPNALVTGDGLDWVRPGEAYEAAFRILVASRSSSRS